MLTRKPLLVLVTERSLQFSNSNSRSRLYYCCSNREHSLGRGVRRQKRQTALVLEPFGFCAGSLGLWQLVDALCAHLLRWQQV